MELAFLLPVLCAGAFAFNVIVARQLGVPWKHRVGAAAALAAVGGAFLLFLYVLGGLFASTEHAPEALRLVGPGAQVFEFDWFAIDGYRFPVSFVVDWLSVMMLGVVSGLSFLIQFYSLGYMKGDNRFWWFFAAMSLFTAAMLGLVLSYNLLILYMFWELVGLCSYLLIGFWYDRRSAAEAAKKAFVTTRIGDVGFFIGMLLFFSQVGSFDLGEIFRAVETGRMDATLATVATLLIFAGAVGKSGQFPLHVWLPDAMEGPTPVSALIHAATMVAAGVYLVARTFPLFEHSPVAMAVVATVGTFTAIFAATIALVQRDIKKIMAYSTVSQLGYMMMALGVGAWTAGVFHLFTHAFFKALLFLCAGSVIHAVNTNDIFQMGGLRRYQPITFVTCVVAALALAGVFPLAGFWSKDEILAGSLLSGAWLAYLVGLVTAFLTAFYAFRMIILTFLGKPRWATGTGHNPSVEAHAAAAAAAPGAATTHHSSLITRHSSGVHESPWTMWVPLALIAIPTTIAGWLNIPFLLPAFASVLHPPVEAAEPHADPLITILLSVIALGTALLGMLLAFAIYHWRVVPAEVLGRQFAGAYRTLANKYYFDELYQWVIDRVVLVVSAFVALFDRKVINNGGVDGSVRYGVLAPGRELRYTETGRVYNYAFAFVVGIVAVLVIMWYWPQIDVRLW